MTKDFLTTKRTKDTKVSDNYYSELRALRVLRGEYSFTLNPEEPFFSPAPAV
jgi:hypothetical protein